MDPEHSVTLTFFFSRLYPLTHWIDFSILRKSIFLRDAWPRKAGRSKGGGSRSRALFMRFDGDEKGEHAKALRLQEILLVS